VVGEKLLVLGGESGELGLEGSVLLFGFGHLAEELAVDGLAVEEASDKCIGIFNISSEFNLCKRVLSNSKFIHFLNHFIFQNFFNKKMSM
jgi:hypothetical protein